MAEKQPMYKQIAQGIQQKIQSGEFAPGDQLPNEAELSEQNNGASRNTIRDAVKWLASRGLVRTMPGKGTFVSDHIEPFVTTLSEDRDPEKSMAGGEGQAAFSEIRDRQLQMMDEERVDAGRPPLTEKQKARILAAMDDPAQDAVTPPLKDEERRDILANLPWGKPEAPALTMEVKEAPGWVVERLRIQDEEEKEVIVRHQRLHVGETPWSLQTTFYPMSLIQRGASALLRPRDIKEGAVKYLQDLGVEQCGSRLRILVRPPDEDEARFFGLPDDGRISVVSLIRTGYEAKPGIGPFPYRVTVTVLPADRNQFVVNRGDVPDEFAAPARDQDNPA